MKSKLMMLAAVAAMSFGAHADLLYFLVNSYSPKGAYNFDYAMVGVAKNVEGTWTTTWGGPDSDKKVYLQVKGEKGVWGDYVDSNPAGPYTEAGPAWADVSDYTTGDYAFYVETYLDSKGDPIWGFDESTALGYAALQARGHIYEDITDTPNLTAWAIPEPTSGLLLLFGFAALSLRRKRV